jgi:hypothetical protein
VVLLDWITSRLLPTGQLFDFPRFVGREYRGSFREMTVSYGTEMGPFFDRWVWTEMLPTLLWALLV